MNSDDVAAGILKAVFAIFILWWGLNIALSLVGWVLGAAR